MIQRTLLPDMSANQLHPPFEAYSGSDPFVFVCYSHQDTEHVYPEIEKWHEGGYRIWYDEGIPAGRKWRPEIKAVWRRWDHANINLLIAGTYTPFAITLLQGRQRENALDAYHGLKRGEDRS